MVSPRVEIRPEYSAQRRSQQPNPAVIRVFDALSSIRGNKGLFGSVADLGCGKLRHFKLLSNMANTLFLVDTKHQIGATHVDGGVRYTIPEVAERARRYGRKVYALTFEEFIDSKYPIDIAFCIAVFDVVLRKTRKTITRVTSRKLSPKGYFVIIVPRNDSSILRRCLTENIYLDGHVFSHHGIKTFFSNFRDYSSIILDCKAEGLTLIADLSSYRQVCLIFSPTSTKNK